MNAILSKMMSGFVFPSARRRAWRARAKISKLSENNEIDVCDEVLPRIKLNVIGTGNRVVVRHPLPGKGILVITIVGNGCNVEIGERVSIGELLKISIGNQQKDLGPVEDVNVSIGRSVGFNGDATIMTYNSHARVEIGDESLFGPGVMVYQTDGHPVYDLATGRMTNHVWDASCRKACLDRGPCDTAQERFRPGRMHSGAWQRGDWALRGGELRDIGQSRSVRAQGRGVEVGRSRVRSQPCRYVIQFKP